LYSTIQSDYDRAAIQGALDRLQQWCFDWQLNINIDKCHVLHIGRKPTNCTYFINGCQVGATDVVPDLGVSIDPLLKFDEHINKIIGKAYSRVGVLFKGFASRNIAVLKLAYVTYIRPLLEYASNVWSPHLIKHINAIERVQKRFTKRIPLLSRLSYPERLALIDLEPLELRRLKADLVLYYKCLHNLSALSSDVYFSTNLYSSNTRSGGNHLSIPLCSTNAFKNDFFNRNLVCWNSLPLFAINAVSVNSFKHILSSINFKPFLICSYF
jgi:hypothetical protein